MLSCPYHLCICRTRGNPRQVAAASMEKASQQKRGQDTHTHTTAATPLRILLSTTNCLGKWQMAILGSTRRCDCMVVDCTDPTVMLSYADPSRAQTRPSPKYLAVRQGSVSPPSSPPRSSASRTPFRGTPNQSANHLSSSFLTAISD